MQRATEVTTSASSLLMNPVFLIHDKEKKAMKKQLFLVIMVSILVFAAVPAGATATFVVDDDGVDCPTALYTTIQDAADAASPGDTIQVCTGTYAGAVVEKTLQFRATGNVVINDGPNSHPPLRAGFLFLGDGAGSGSIITGFHFEGTPQDGYVDDGYLDFPIFSRGADNVTVDHNDISNSLQAVTNWGGSGWKIRFNDITNLWTLNGGGIGILIGDNHITGGAVMNNVVSFNKISGVLAVLPGDGGGYCGTGIVLYSDSRRGPAEDDISGNRVTRNKVSLMSDTPGLVDVVAIELTDTANSDPAVVFGNTIGFNDLRGTETGIALSPLSLEDDNTISRNLGDVRDRRDDGVHPPSAF